MFKIIREFISITRYPHCNRNVCGNNKDGECVKLNLGKYVECRENLHNWNKHY